MISQDSPSKLYARCFQVSVIPPTAVIKHAVAMTCVVLMRSKDGTRHDTRCAPVMLMTIAVPSVTVSNVIEMYLIIFHFKDREHKTHGRYVMFVH